MPDRQRLLELALMGLQAERRTIDDEIADIKSQMNHRPATAGSPASLVSAQPRKKRKMSAAARRKISEAMKRIHAERRQSAKK